MIAPPKPPHTLTVSLLSDTTFGRGEGAAGEVDVEVEHDDLGLPFLGGKTLHGLLRDTWLTMLPAFAELRWGGERVFGPPGDLTETAILRLGDAVVEAEARAWIAAAVQRARQPLAPADVLATLTDIRRQTAEERTSGAPAAATLRASRVTLRQLTFYSPLTWLAAPEALDLRCLALAAWGTRHAGLGRNRGRGHVQLALDGDLKTTHLLAEGK